MSSFPPLKVDESLPENIVKFVHPDGREQVISLQSGSPQLVIEATEE